jgi:uncharacterized DUF497 family protein
MLFEWDANKAKTNLEKHGISFELAATIFSDPLHLSIPEQTKGEERWVTIGCAADLSTLVVVHTYIDRTDNGEVLRIISARKATKKERNQYEEGI